MNVLVIPEDFPHDQYVLKPIVEAMLKAVGKPHAKVIVCKDPRLGGVEQVLKWDNIQKNHQPLPRHDRFISALR